MTTTSDSTVSLSYAKSRPRDCKRLCRKLVLGLFEHFTEDALEVILPEGERRRYGSTSREQTPARLEIRSPRFFRRIVLDGEIGFGEAHTAGEWESDDLARVIRFLIRNVEHNPGLSGSRRKQTLFNVLHWAQRLGVYLRRNTKSQSRANISAHYDLSNTFYRLWLDDSLTYSSGYFEDASQSLEAAQEAKYRKLAERLDLKPGQHVLEIGSGWGGNAIFLAREYGVQVTSVTISTEQYTLAQERVLEAGLEGRVDIRFRDYRDLTGSFDTIVSIEMLEAVGHNFLATFFEQCQRLLAPHGQLGLQVILTPDSRYDEARNSADWIKKHIFPGGQLPSLAAINTAINRTGSLSLQHFESFGRHYAHTLRHWAERFEAKLEDVRALGFDETFIRKWRYYLAYCEAAFDTAHINVAQLVYAFPNREGRALQPLN